MIIRLIAIAAFLLVTRSADAGDRESFRGAAPEILALESCEQHVVTPGKLAWPREARGEFRAVVVVAYDLDGSGRATNIELIDSRPRRLFADATLRVVKDSEFLAGVIREDCIHVGDYAGVRRR